MKTLSQLWVLWNKSILNVVAAIMVTKMTVFGNYIQIDTDLRQLTNFTHQNASVIRKKHAARKDMRKTAKNIRNFAKHSKRSIR